jgi:hypothetical protein
MTTTKRRCRAQTATGRPCNAWAVRGSDPPLCSAHSRGREPASVQAGKAPADTEDLPTATARESEEGGFYSTDPSEVSINDAIAGLVDKMLRLDDLIVAHEGPNGYLIELFTIYTQASSRLARLLRDRRALSGDAADGFASAIALALDELSTEWGVEL